MKTNLLLLIIFTAFFTANAGAFHAPAQEPPIVGGFSGASKTDPEVLAAAAFAVKQERRKLGRRLSLISIEHAEVQVVAGLNYRVCMKVRIKGSIEEATAVVYKNLKQKYSLSTWVAGRCKTTT